MERYRVLIENKPGGRILVSFNLGKTWTQLGKVNQSDDGGAHHITDNEFTASDWANVGAVAASSVNAIHIKVGQPDKHALVFSILPRELWDDHLYTTFRDQACAIGTNIPAGTALFQAMAAPRVGDPLYLVTGENWVPWPDGRAPERDDVLGIVARRSRLRNWVIEFENKPGGLVWLTVGREPRQKIARVHKPVSGTGRFTGGMFQSLGRIRANHPGVIDIKTSERGALGGFQIVPFFHGSSDNLKYVFTSPAYMVVKSANADGSPLEGTFPLYTSLIRPGDIVDAKINGRWQRMPTSIGKNLDSLRHLEGFRIRPGFGTL